MILPMKKYLYHIMMIQKMKFNFLKNSLNYFFIFINKKMSCKDCKSKLDRENITDRKSYISWLKKNHPDKVGGSGGNVREAEELFKIVKDCYSDWFGNDKKCP